MSGRYASAPTAPSNTAAPNLPPPRSNQWHPTVAYLVLLVIAEYATLAALRYVFRHSHGG